MERSHLSIGHDDDDLSDYSISDFSDLDEDINDTTMPGGYEAFQDELLDEINAKNKQLEQLHQQVVDLEAKQKRTEEVLKQAQENQDQSQTQQQATEQELLKTNQVLEGANRHLQAQVRKYEELEMERLLLQPESPVSPVAASKPQVDSQGVQTDPIVEKERAPLQGGSVQTDLTGPVMPPPLQASVESAETQTEKGPEEPSLPLVVSKASTSTQGSQTQSSWQTAHAQTHMETVSTTTTAVDTSGLTSSRTSEAQTVPQGAGEDEAWERAEAASEDVDSDAEGEDSEEPEKPVDRRLAKLSVVTTSSRESAGDSMLLLCNVCNQYINMGELEAHSRTCNVMSPVRAVKWEVIEDGEAKKGSKEDETLVRDVKYERDETETELEEVGKRVEQRLEEIAGKLKELQDKSKKGDPANDDSLTRLLEEQLRLRDQLVALLKAQKMHAMRRAANYNYQLTYANKEIKRLGAVIYSTHLEEKFDTEEEIVRAMLGEDLSYEKVVNFRICGWLLKRSDNLKIWNKRFFILVDKFLIYYLKKKEGLQPRQVCVLNNVVVKNLPESTISKKHGFRVNTSKHEYLLVANNVNERQIWVEAIEKAGKWWDTDAYASQLVIPFFNFLPNFSVSKSLMASIPFFLMPSNPTTPWTSSGCTFVFLNLKKNNII